MDLETAGAILGITLSVLALVGAGWKWVVLPNLREQLLKPVQETHRQVAVNGGLNNPPTLLDKVGTIDTKVDGFGVELQQLRRDFTDHLLNASRDEAAMWAAIEAIAKSQPPGE